ncbi:YeeE/YedE family protein [Haloarchaeobius litoreus]|uniref:YeeE/YedE family protein n=1 Tax=Haloarchaeobius litoreus TaxID=755306 RepID=A0ABD6DPR6_9EURY|nr:YeeE/YedE family protein [Haloarchaeobius litoreus]
MSSAERSPLFLPAIYVGGLVFGLGLAISGMARPEVVLDFLQFQDFGLLFVMGGAAVVTGITFFVATTFLGRAPITGDEYKRRVKSFDRNVVIGGSIFGVGWGLSGICPGAAYASLGIGNYPILWAIAGMFLGAYAQGYWRSARSADATEQEADHATSQD